MNDEILDGLRKALASIVAPRFYETERGFQGELLLQLGKHLVLPDQAILEQEHQKRSKYHGLTLRPDIIIHEPFDPDRHRGRYEGNFAVLELKLKAGPKEAQADFESLADMVRILRYPLGIFLNIGSDMTYRDLVPNEFRGQIVTIAVRLEDGVVRLVEDRD